MPEETPLQRLRRLESGEPAAAGAPAGSGRAGKTAAVAGGTALAALKGPGVFMLLLGKLKFLFLAAKLAPMLGTLATMLVSIEVYAAAYGWSLAAGFVGLILFHELGHGYAAQRLGLKVGAPVFIPFFGAVIALKEQPRSTWVECLVAAGGPAAGLFGAAACALASLFLPARAGYLLALAQITATINLFNLLPAGGLDGDRITQPLQREHWLPTLLAIAAICLAASLNAGRLESITFMILIVAGIKAWRHYSGPSASLLDKLADAGRYSKEADDTTPERRRAAMTIFVGLALGLAVVAALTGRLAPGL